MQEPEARTQSRSELERIETAARAYCRARYAGIPWPEVVAARERLRVALGEPPEPSPPVKPWDR
ncbi:MAG: hypothetical protein K8I27_05270 [Planctomycetes bacterium]|nr:hypothetical protein [Planctomycetota bacterium]